MRRTQAFRAAARYTRAVPTPSSSPLTPRFSDPTLEAAWRAHQDDEARGPVRIGLAAFGILVVLAGLGDPWQAYAGWQTVLVIRLVLWGPLLLGGAWLLSLPRARGRTLDVTFAVCVAVTLSLVAAMVFALPRGAAVDYPMYWTVLLLLVHVLAPLGFLRSTIAGAVVVGGFFATMVRHDAASGPHFAAHAVFLLFAWAGLVAGSWLSERRARASFLAERRQRELEAQLRHVQKMEAIGAFVGGVAHEFNNVLTPILGGVELTANTLPSDHPLQPPLATVGRAGERAAALVQQLLALGRKSEIAPRAVDLSAAVAEALALIGPTMDRRITVTFDPGPDAWALADPGQIQQVVLNLCLNARDALLAAPHPDRAPCIALSVRRVRLGAADVAGDPVARAGEWVELRVADTGPGIPADVLARVFEPFFTTKRQGEGSGLGLSVLHGIVGQHGGWVSVDGGVGTGATFRCLFPATEAAPAPAPAPRGPAPRSAPAGVRRVLVVDDEEAVRSVARAALEHAGYVVDDEARAVAALERLAAGYRPDVVLLDVRMPELDGWRALPRIRAVDPTLPVVMITGFDDRADDAPRTDRPDATVLKPFRLRDLVAKVDAVVARASERASG